MPPKIHCPPLEHNYPTYVILQHVLSCFTVPINIFAIYCIIFRSPKNIGNYRWHLLWHQVLAAFVDFVLGVLVIPLYLLPFPIIIPCGLISYLPVFPTHGLTVFVFILICSSLAAVVQLFVYRYLKATGKAEIPWTWILFIGFTYLLCWTPGLGFEFIYEKNQKKFLQELSKNFTCITKELINTPGIVGYSPTGIGFFVGIPIVAVNLYMVIVCGILIHYTKIYLSGNVLSERTAKLERKFLFNLIIQVAVPVIVVHFPGLFLMYVQAMRIYSYEELGLVSIGILSIYGAMCSIMIILLTPHYRSLVFCRGTIGPISSSEREPTKIIVSQGPRRSSRQTF